MEDKIILYPSNWLYNAGVIGLLRVMDFAKKKNVFIFQDDGSVEIEMSCLDNFELFYFEYVSKLYLIQRFSIKELSNFIHEYVSKMGEESNNEMVKIEAKVKEIGSDIKNKVLNISSSDKWHEFIKEIDEIKIALQKNIEEIKNKLESTKIDNGQREKLLKIVDNIYKNFDNFRQSISEFKAQADFLGSFYFNKGVIANPKGKSLKRPEDFRKKYLDTIIKANHGENLCILCGRSSSEEDFSELVEGDFSILGISRSGFSNFYNFFLENGYSYNQKCSLCQLILLCAFAGFNLKPYPLRELDQTDYIFVNYPSFEESFLVNNKIQEEFKNFQFGIFTEKPNTYLKSLELITEVAKKKEIWLLENIYFAEIKISLRKDQTKPKFVYFNIDRDFAEIFSEFKEIDKFLKNLAFKYEISKNNSIYLSTEVLKRLLDKKPIIYISFKMLSEKISQRNTDMLPLWSMILLEFLINQKRRSNMSAKTSYGILKGIQESGMISFSLEEIDQEKRFHISQRFLTLVRGARKEDFYNELLRLFVVFKKPIPENLFSLLTEREDISFQEKALAFITGFINPSKVLEGSKINISKEVKNE